MLKWIFWRNHAVLRWSLPPMEKCRRMKRPQFTSKSWVYSWPWTSSKTRQQSCRSESFAMNTDILTNGSTVRNHISLKTVFEYSATRRTSFRSWFLACQVHLLYRHRPQRHFWNRRVIPHHLLHPHLLHLHQCKCLIRLMIDQGNLMKPR